MGQRQYAAKRGFPDSYYGIHEPPTLIAGRVKSVILCLLALWAWGAVGSSFGSANTKSTQPTTVLSADLAAVIREYNVSYVYVGNGRN